MVSAEIGKFGSFFPVSEREVSITARINSNRNIAILFTLFVISQLYLGAGPISPIYHFAAALALFSSAISTYLVLLTNKETYLLINLAVIVLVPLIVEPEVENPWISYGLVLTVPILMIASFGKLIVLIPTLLIGVFLQYSVASLKLTGLTDNADTLLLGSYFSTAWLIVSGFGLFLTTKIYLRFCDTIDADLMQIEDKILEEQEAISHINLNDFRNVTIHGTILNTLIAAIQLIGKPDFKATLISQLETDLNNLQSLVGKNKLALPYETFLSTNLNIPGITIAVKNVPQGELNRDNRERTLELIREILLNIRKHTNSRRANISVEIVQSNIEVCVTEFFESRVDLVQAENLVSQANQSLTLKRLNKVIFGKLNVEPLSDNSGILHTIKIPINPAPFSALDKVKSLRQKSVARNVEWLTGISFVYASVAVPGFIFLNVPFFIVLTLIISMGLIGVEIFSKLKSQWRPILAQFLLSLLIPYHFIFQVSCSELTYTPWLFNSVFGFLLFGLVFVKNSVFKYLPTIVFIIEALSTRYFFPAECQNLLNGSTPGYVMVLIIGFYINRLRTRNLKLDAEIQDSMSNILHDSADRSKEVNDARDELLNEFNLFLETFKIETQSEKQMLSLIDNWIARFRLFLICSEYFDSPLVRKIFWFAMERISKGRLVTISIYYQGKLTKYDLNVLQMRTLENAVEGMDFEIVISKSDRLQVEIYSKSGIVHQISL